MRKLATIKQIKEKRPIEGADLIESVRIDGWWCVSKKDEFQVDDKCIYFEVDSVLPIEPRFEFLRKTCYVNKDWIEGFRLKTVRFRGQVSQGLALPVGEFKDLELGKDVTDLLNVKKWDPPIPAQLAGEVKGNFPTFIKKTDQERIQNVYEEYTKFKDMEFEGTLKLDGSSCTIYYRDGEFGVCSRNLELKLDSEKNNSNTFVQIAKKYEHVLKGYGRNIAIQGEAMGPGIQGNREKLKEAEFFVFDIFDIDSHGYMTRLDRMDIVSQLGLKHAPVISSNETILDNTLDEILSKSEIKSLNHNIAEGIVWKCLKIPNVSFKAINNKFLLKEK